MLNKYWENPKGRRYTYRKYIAHYLRRWGQKSDKHLVTILGLIAAALIAFLIY